MDDPHDVADCPKCVELREQVADLRRVIEETPDRRVVTLAQQVTSLQRENRRMRYFVDSA